ncbi:MAG: bifunctional helix-turn-helix domain-containing protein/methylated-DNA--[protein]-cysteine S-methyltransferase [Aestuariivirgaceae bacterium]|nr:bifunctional helix-turn-helix domain-containing protein/methylated-DNA--[protein]-cysteine S-methyltransferase [Aestuariivirgaceae bacterium]
MEHTADYAHVKQALAFISENWREQPSLEVIAAQSGLSPFHLQKLFTRWAGLSPKAFLQAVTLDHARSLLRKDANLLDAAYELGLSGPGRLHDLFVSHEGMTPGVYKARGRGLTITYGFHPSPFGTALIMTTLGRLAGLAFAEENGEVAALADMTRRWPQADYMEDQAATAALARRVFSRHEWSKDQPLKIIFIGTDFEIRVWETLLSIPLGSASTYSDVAAKLGMPKASRAVGSAVGRNPLAFVVPCHRVLGKSGALHGYHWGLTRKRAMLGWEAGAVQTSL